MKAVITLSVLQLIVILFLLLKVTATDEQVATQAGSPAPPVRPGTSVTVDNVGGNTTGFDERALRKIVREELHRQLSQLQFEAARSVVAEETPDTVSKAEYQYRLDSALQSLDYHIEQGEISDADMAQLQQRLITLDDEGRRQLLSLISKALSSGALKGNF